MKLHILKLIFIASLLSIANVAYSAPEKPESGLHGTDVIKENQPSQTRGLNVLHNSNITSTQAPSVEQDPSLNESLKELEKKNSQQKKLTQEPKTE